MSKHAVPSSAAESGLFARALVIVPRLDLPPKPNLSRRLGFRLLLLVLLVRFVQVEAREAEIASGIWIQSAMF
jgi:hypothetical protein